jgi:hypothetical protein
MIELNKTAYLPESARNDREKKSKRPSHDYYRDENILHESRKKTPLTAYKSP